LSFHHFWSKRGVVLELKALKTVAEKSDSPRADHLRNDSHAELAAASPTVETVQLTGLSRQSVQATDGLLDWHLS
jgi:hypothetical protein